MRSSALAILVIIGAAVTPATAGAKSCADYPDQASAQRAADTRDGDHDGVYCESLPCPCSKKKPTGSGKDNKQSCTKPSAVQRVSFSLAKYPNIHAHFVNALRKGWPRTLVVHRRKTAFRREHLLDRYPPRKGFDRDEYPPAIGRDDWRADVAYVPSRENRSHGSSLGAQLRRFCSGTRFQYVFF